MKRLLITGIISVILTAPNILLAQGWVMDVTVDLQTSDCFLEDITSGTFSYTATGQSGSVTPSSIQPFLATFRLNGTGSSTSGNMSVNVSGVCNGPPDFQTTYGSSIGASRTVAVGISATDVCNSQSFSISPIPSPGQSGLSITVNYYPRLRVEDPNPTIEKCSKITFTSAVCAIGNFIWSVSDQEVGPYTDIGSSTGSYTVDIPTIRNLYTRKHGRFYVKVRDSGITGRESPFQTFDLDALPPTASFQASQAVSCNGGNDGEINLIITPSIPEIDKFVVYGFRQGNPFNDPSNPDDWDPDVTIDDVATGFLNITSSDTETNNSGNLIGILAGNWDFKIINNTAGYGTCETLYLNATVVTEPPPVTVNLQPKPVTCYGGSDGEMTAVASGGVGGYTYEWPHNASETTNKAINLTAGSYTVKVKDANNCPAEQSATDTETISQPSDVVIVPASITISNHNNSGFEVSCLGKTDGSVSLLAGGGAGGYTYSWSSGETTNAIMNKGVGTYILTVTDTKGCTDVTQYTLEAPLPIDFTLEETETIQCAGDATGAISVNSITNEIGDTFFAWSTGETTPEISGKPANTYTVTVSDDQGCSTTKSHQLIEPGAYTVSIQVLSDFNGKPIQCNGNSNGLLGTTVLNEFGTPVPAGNYEWFKNGSPYPSGGGLDQIDQLSEGFYKVVITYNNDECIAESAQLFLDDPDPVSPVLTIPSIIEHNGKHISCTGASDGSMHAAGDGGTAPYTYLWNTTESGSDISGKPAGTYTVTATDVNGCTGSSSMALVDPLPVNPSITIVSNYNGFPVKCHNTSDGHLVASATGGAGTFSYLWNTGDNQANVFNIAAGTYTVTVTDINGCSESVSKIVTKPDTVKTSIAILSLSDFNGQAISCYNKADGRLEAIAEGGTNSFTYAWNPGGSGKILSGASAGTYIVTTTDTNGCTAKDTVTLDNPTPVTANITAFSNYNGYGVKCSGTNEGFIEAGGSGGTNSYTFYWPETLETTFRNANLTAGIYSVIVKDSNGCPDTVTHVVTQPPAVTLSVASFADITCFEGSNGSLTFSGTGGAGGFQYTLNNIDWQISPGFSGLKAIMHTGKVRDVNGCTSTFTKTLVQPEKIQIAVVTEPAFCADPRGKATASVTGGVGSYNYEWKDPQNNVIGITNLIQDQWAGIYTLKVLDGNSCPMTENVGITSTDGAQVIVKETIDAKCSYAADGSALLEVISGDGPFTFLWPNGQTTILGSDLAKGIHQVSVRDKNNCLTVQPVEIKAPDALSVALVQNTSPTCNGNCDGKIRVLAGGGTGVYTYTWAGQSGDEAQNLCAGDHNVTVTDSNNCTTNQTFTLLQPDPLDLDLVRRILPLCHSGCNGEIEVVAGGGNGGYAYTWNTGKSTAIASGICAGDHIVTVTDSKNCSLAATYQLGEPTLLQVRQTRKRIPTCHDGCDGALEVEAFGGTGAYAYLWNNGISNANIASLCSSDYTVTITDANACNVSQTYTLENPPPLLIDLGGSVTLCTGQTYTLDAGTGWSTYKWNSNTGLAASTSKIVIEDAGQYWLEVINSDGCTAQDTFLLETSLDLLKASFLIPKEALVGDTIAIIDISWPLPENTTWTFPVAMEKIMDLGDIVYGKFSEPGIYEVGLQTFLGQCTDAIGKTILILKGESDTEGGRLGYDEYVKEFTLFPNPTDGDFEVTAEFTEAGPATLSIWNSPTGYLVKKVQDSGKSRYHFHFDLRPLSTGTYVLRLDHAKGRKYIRFVVN